MDEVLGREKVENKSDYRGKPPLWRDFGASIINKTP